MELTKVNIGEDRYFNKFELSDKTNISEATTKEDFDSPDEPIKEDATLIQSSIKIGFDTSTGELRDGEYATQENGFHWIKISGYAVTKINPEFIKDSILSPEGEVDVKERSEAE